MQHSRTQLLAVGLGAAALVLAGSLPAQAGGGHRHGHHHPTMSPVTALSGPRGVDSVIPGVTLVAEDTGNVSLVIERRHRKAKVIKLAGLPESAGFASAVSTARGKVWMVTGAGDPGTGAATLYKLRHHRFVPVADIAAYQATDPDPYDLEDFPEDSNPFGVVALRDGTVLVSDAAGNDLLRVWPNGRIKTVARLMPRTVETPEGLPPTDPDGNPLPPAGTPIPSEAVATSVTVGSDGYWYVGELRGFPATTGTSQIWRIRPGSVGATCNPERPRHGKCQRYADGLTSIVDLASGRHGRIYAVTLSKMSWLAVELGLPGAEVGGLFELNHWGHKVRELAKGQVILPGGADVASNGDIYLTGPVFGPGSLAKIR